MSTASPPLTTCPACGTPIEKDGACPRCQAVDDRKEQIEAVDFVLRRLEERFKAGWLKERQWQAISQFYGRARQALTAADQAGTLVQANKNLPRRDRCWSCKEAVSGSASHCEGCGAPAGPAVKSLRFYRFLACELDKLQVAGTITLQQLHELSGETQERIAALERKLEKDRAPLVTLVTDEDAPVKSRRPLMEVLLDPQTIQWLLASGGVLVVIGLVIVMASLELFTPIVVALCLGVGNAVVLGGGWWLTLRTRYQLAGRALTLLACLVMPLNLWYYDSKGLLGLQDQLWVAALVCSGIYATSAWVLKDRVFVYVLVGGVTMTGLLVLGTDYVHSLKEILAPSTLLVVLGLICLHAERAFAPGDGPFSRQRFGLAFFWCAHALLGAGLLLLMGAQIVGWLYGPMLQRLIADVPVVVQAEYLPWTLALALLGTYAYVYSDVVVRRIGVYIHLAAVTLLWVAVQVLMQVNIADKAAVVIAVLALAGLAINFVQVQFRDKGEFLRTVVPLGAMLSLLPVVLGVLLHFRAHLLHERWPFAVSWATVGAMAVTALSCRAGAYLYGRQNPTLTAFYFFATAAATLVFAAEFTEIVGLESWWSQAPVVMLIPIGYLVAARLYRGRTPEQPLIGCAQASTAVMLLCSLYVFVAGIIPQLADITGIPEFQNRHHLLLAVFCLEAAVFYGLSAALQKAGWNIYLTTLMLCGVIWQLLDFFGTAHEFYPLAFVLLGLALLIAYRFAVLEKWQWAGLSRAGFQSANALTLLGFAAGALLSLSRWALDELQLARIDNLLNPAEGDWHNPVKHALFLVVFLGLVGLVAAWLVQQQAWRRVYFVLAILNGALTALLFHKLNREHPWVTLEAISVLAGLVILVLGHLGWYRETEERSSETVSFALFFGTLAVLVPLAIATVHHRFYTEGRHVRLTELFSWIDELALVIACVVFLGSGIVCRLKVTTSFGLLTLIAYVLMVLIHVMHRVSGQWVVGMYLAIGGALLFGTGIVLSVFRDRLLTLPDRIHRREGVFRIFAWR